MTIEDQEVNVFHFFFYKIYKFLKDLLPSFIQNVYDETTFFFKHFPLNFLVVWAIDPHSTFV